MANNWRVADDVDRGGIRREGVALADRSRINATSIIELRPYTEMTQLWGDLPDELDAVSWRTGKTGSEEKHSIQRVFVFVGADPETDWLDGCGISLDATASF